MPEIRIRSIPRSSDASLHLLADAPTRQVSSLCRYAELDSSNFRRQLQALHEPWRPHRKLWEFAFICQALEERGMLEAGKRGLGFAVGQEKLPSYFASRGVAVTASDLPQSDERSRMWNQSSQWSPGLQALNVHGLCSAIKFHELATFRAVDMNNIPDDLTGFDFTWSSCSFEHCGSIALGLRFMEQQMRCLAPGGVAVHTTEFNLTSNDKTVTEGSYIVFRLRDIEGLCSRLRAAGHEVEPLDLEPGTHPLDAHVVPPPYVGDHMRLDLQGFAATSIGLIVRKSPD